MLNLILKQASKAIGVVRKDLEKCQPYFDVGYYLEMYPDVAHAKAEPFEHFIESGWREGRNPSSQFNTIWYLHFNESVARSGVNPLLDYALKLLDKSSDSFATRPPDGSGDDWIGDATKNPYLPQECREYLAAYDTIRRSGFFDPNFYRSNYPKVPGDPIEHYVRYGWKMGLDPSRYFNSKWYVENYSDVRVANVNPLLHYLRHGRDEGRRPLPEAKITSRGLQAMRLQNKTSRPAGRRERASGAYAAHYLEQISVAQGARDPRYAPIAQKTVGVAPDDPLILAFYLPQFHPFAENDQWWGKGFTEWTNVSKAVAQFNGHYQPRLPGEFGFYDLRLPEIMARQIELAKLYGISGFCFHYYWFDGHRLLQRPIDQFLSERSEAFALPFCLCWANENWTRRWDGAEHDILMKQNHTLEDHERVFADLYRYMKDPRYLRIEGKPVVLVYRPDIIPNIQSMSEIWRGLAAEAGLPGLYLVATTAFGFSRPEDIGFDALCQFPPHAVHIGAINESLEMLNPSFSGSVYRYGDVVDAYLRILKNKGGEKRPTDFIPGVMPSWDNEARKPGGGHVFHDSTPEQFHRWLRGAVDWAREHSTEGRRLVFINAWNEWAEGAYLEPDRKFGYAYLAAVANVRTQALCNAGALKSLATKVAAKGKKRSDAVLCVHLFYEDLIDEFAEAVAEAQKERRFDVILSIPELWSQNSAENAIKLIDPVRIIVSENKGRDVWPFLQALRTAQELGYKIGCKIHSKKSPHLAKGDEWRRGLLDGLIGKAAIKSALACFTFDSNVGLVAPAEAMFSIQDASAMRDNKVNMDSILSKAGIRNAELVDFVAGTMFWFRLPAMTKVANLPIDSSDFEPELGAIDGTIAHAFERLFPTFVKAGGYKIANYSSAGAKAPY